MAKTLVFFEHEAQVEDYFKNSRGPGDCVFVALGPFASLALGRHGIKHRLAEDYYPRKELYRIGMGNYARLEKICEIIDRRLSEECPGLRARKIRPALFNFYELKADYDMAAFTLCRITKIIAAEKPSTIIFYENWKCPIASLRFDNRESLGAMLLASRAWGAKLVALPAIEPPGYGMRTIAARKALAKLKLLLQANRHIFRMVTGAKKDGMGSVLGKAGKKGGASVMLFGTGYNWDRSREELRAHGIGNIAWMRDDIDYWLMGPKPEMVSHAAMEKLRVDKGFRSLFVFNGIDLFSMLEARISYLAEKLVPACCAAYDEAAATMKEEGCRALLAAHLATCTAKSAAQAARNLGVLVVGWQHGGSYGYADHPMVPYIDMMNADFVLLFGNGVVEKFEKGGRKFGAKLVPIGSASLDSMPKAAQAKELEKTVLYATTNFCQNFIYASLPPVYSDNLMWKTQKEILDVLGRQDDCDVLVKTHASFAYRETPLREYAQAQGFKNCRFVKDEASFGRLLSESGIVAIDFPSTTLLEALTSSKPVFVCTEHLKMDAGAERLLKRRAFCYKTSKKMADGLDAYLKGAKMKVDLNDREFLKRYGTYKDDGKSAQRAAKFVAELVK